MSLLVSSKQDGRQRSACRLLLAFFWLTGFLSGICWCMFAEDTMAALVRRLPYCPAPLGTALFAAVLPFFISALVVRYFGVAALFPVVFIDAFLLAAASFGFVLAYESSGWLISGIVMIGRWVCVPLLYLMWLRCIAAFHNGSFMEWLLFLSLAILAESICFCIISPYLACLIII